MQQQCPNCGHLNRVGVVFCENCGASLIGKAPLGTKSVEDSSEEEKEQLGMDASVLTNVKVQGRSRFAEDNALRLEIDGSLEPIVFKPKTETIFGRRDPATGALPDVDLTPFAGYRMGVSRRHAAIRLGEDSTLNVWDLGSSNGTFLNGERLSAHRPYRLHDGDELRLGQMMILVTFAEETEVPPVTDQPKDSATVPEPPIPASESQVAEKDAAESPAGSLKIPESPGAKKPITVPIPEKPASMPESPKPQAQSEQSESPPSAPPDKQPQPDSASSQTQPDAVAKPEVAATPDAVDKQPQPDSAPSQVQPVEVAKPEAAAAPGTVDKQPQPETAPSQVQPAEAAKPEAAATPDAVDKSTEGEQPDSPDEKKRD